MSSPTGRRSVPLLNGGLAAVLVVVLAAVALVVQPPAPPGIAEFAPRATKPISRAPSAQSLLGGQRRGCLRVSCTGQLGAVAAPRPVRVVAGRDALGTPSALQCFAWADGSITQTFDPQSPPCIASWPAQVAGNGGATAPGVTGTSVTVAVPVGQSDRADKEAASLAAFFSSHFQLYGRSLKLAFYAAASRDQPSQLRAAGLAAAERQPFAATMTDNPLPQDATDFMAPLLARRVVLVQGQPMLGVTSAVLARSQPYLWSQAPAIDVVLRNVAGSACSSLPAGGRAQYAAGTEALRQRKLAVVSIHSSGIRDPDNGPLLAQLARCGVTAKAYVFPYAANSDVAAGGGQMSQLKADGVTSLLARGNAGAVGLLQVMAQSAGFTPEWILTGDPGQDDELNLATLGPQMSHAMGVAWWDKHLPIAVSPGSQALHAVDPSAEFGARGPDNSQALYQSLQLIAAGIQAAGPHLTPATFAAGLRALDYPNPGAAAAPAYQAAVSFGPAPTATHDFAAWSWSTSVRSNQSPKSYQSQSQGATCDVLRGRRWSLEAGWPAALPLFDSSAPCY